MDVRIGVIHTMKEIEVELGSDADRKVIRGEVEAVLSGESKVLWLTDKSGKDHGVAADKIAWVEISGSDSERRIGFVH